jgi:hypothetical protein
VGADVRLEAPIFRQPYPNRLILRNRGRFRCNRRAAATLLTHV